MGIPYSLKPERKKSKFNPINCFLILIVLLLIIGVAGYFGFRFWYSSGVNEPNSDDPTVVEINIASGTSSKEIGQILYEEGVISNTYLWDIYLKLNNPSLLADTYKIPRNLSIKQVAETLSKAPENRTVWITFPEGIGITEVERIVQDTQSQFDEDSFSAFEFADILDNPDKYTFSPENQAFLDEYKPQGKNLEGFLYPNTYAFEADSEPMDIVNIILDEFRNQVSELDLTSGEYDFYETLILASIVEKEGLDDNDREIIAGILSNRLEIGMKLGVDATLNYLTGQSERRNSGATLELDSPYNTYKYTGLPPTPISSPRLQSIQVSLNPIETDYYFFLHDEDGTPYYAKDENDHFANVNKYLDN